MSPLHLAAGPATVGGPFDVVVNHVRLAPEDLAKLTSYVADDGIVVSSTSPVPVDDALGTHSERVGRPRCIPPGRPRLPRRQRRLKLHIADRRPLDELAAVH